MTAGGARLATGGRDQGLVRVLVEFARTLGTEFSIQEILDHLVLRIVDLLPVTGAGVMVMGEHADMHFVAASNEVVTRIEGLQNELREGPCLRAFRTGEAVAISDLDLDTRFPRFSPRAAAAGLAAVFTFPMRHGDSRLGAVDLYRDTPGRLSAEDFDTAQTIADVAAAYLSNAQGRLDASAALAQLNHRSLHDPLTGLANRTLLEELLAQAVARARRSHHIAAVLFADLDGFKAVNDRYGHHVGDQLLRSVAGRLTRLLRPGDTLARLGGDEFVLLCEDLHDIAEAETVAERIAAVMAVPFDVAGHRIAITASVGIAFSGPGQDIPHALLGDADFAMYQAKTDGGDRHHVLEAGARLLTTRRDDLERDLQDAERLEQLFLAYQPIVGVGDQKLVAVEALVRWQHPNRGLIGPDLIIPSAERTGMILALGEWVLRHACNDLRSWRGLDTPIPVVAVNVSAHQVIGPDFAGTVARILDETGTDPAAVCLEVTESALLADAGRALAVLRELRDLGVGLSLDDFGTGYSSLSYLRQYPFTIVKIDRSFVADVPTDPVTRSVVAAMIDLSHVLQLAVVAEGVETERELAEITELGADLAQGFHFGHPLTALQLVGSPGLT